MIIQLRALDGSIVEFEDSKIIGKGEMKDVYFSPDKSYVIAFYRSGKLDKEKLIDRLDTIVGLYRNSIFNNKGGDYWAPLYCWPTKVVMYNGKIGLVLPTYRSCFFFKYGSDHNDIGGIKGKEKEGKWFASIRNRMYLDARERGNWKGYIIACMRLAQAVKRLNAAGLAHSDLSYKNVLIDPPTGQISIIDLDGLVVTGKFNPEVMGTTDFIAPEVMKTQHLSLDDPNRVLPSMETDCHALATLIYMYLLNRHPLRGGKVYDLDPDEDEELVMGEKALFIEHPTDPTNRVNVRDLHPMERVTGDPSKTPYTICGPYLKILFERAFIDGLHNPKMRPRAEEWANALIKTFELLVPCSNPRCDHGWFVYERGMLECPFCHRGLQHVLPIFHFYRQRDEQDFSLTNTKFVSYHRRNLSMWLLKHQNTPLEFTTNEDHKPVANITYENNNWYLNNTSIEGLYDISSGYGKPVLVGESVKIVNGSRFRLNDNPKEFLYVILDLKADPPPTLSNESSPVLYNYNFGEGSEEGKIKKREEKIQSQREKIQRADPVFYSKYKFLFVDDEIILPAGLVNREYSFSVADIFPHDCNVKFVGLDTYGLYYLDDQMELKGFPTQVGDISLLINFTFKKFDGLKVQKNARLVINVSNVEVENRGPGEHSGFPELPTATQEQSYRINLRDHFKDIEVESVLGCDELGLSFNSGTMTMQGVPNAVGNFVLKLRYRSKGIGNSRMLLLSKSVVLRILPAIKIIWQNIPTPKDIKFYKVDNFHMHRQVYVNDSMTSSKKIYAVSNRGKMHANNGLPRNADCGIGNVNGWVIIALADGSEKAEFSREGSRVAVYSVIQTLTNNLKKLNGKIDDIVHMLANPDRPENTKRVARTSFEKLMIDGFKQAYQEIIIQSNFASVTPKKFASTLSVVLMKRFDFGWFVLTASVGRFGVAICTGDYDLIPLGYNEYGDYIYRDGVITDDIYIQDKELRHRIDYRICDSLIMLIAMNKELTKELFTNLSNMRNKDLWTEWIADFASKVNLRNTNDDQILDELRNYVETCTTKSIGDETLLLLK